MGSSEGRNGRGRSARCIALVGPYLSGKTTLLEAILARTGAIKRQGSVTDKSSVGDSSIEAREHGMSVELTVADAPYLGENFTFVDCPGSIEFAQETATALLACDAAVIVCEPDARRLPALHAIFKLLEDQGIPHFLFLNKIDQATTRVRDVVAMLQPASARPLVLRQIPIWENGVAAGFIDLALERAFVYRPNAPSEAVDIPAAALEREQEARFQMLEKLADYDEVLMEQLLSDEVPAREVVFSDLAKEFRDGLICPVLLGSAHNGNGVGRLLKALRHEVAGVEETAHRLGITGGRSAAYVFKTMHTAHGGKLSLARMLAGNFTDGGAVFGPHGEERIGGLFSMLGTDARRRAVATAGDTVAFGRLEHVKTGDTVSADKGQVLAVTPIVRPEPVSGTAIILKDRSDEVKLSTALAKLSEEDPSIKVQQDPETHQTQLLGHGEMHLRVTLERLNRKYGLAIERLPLRVPYRETIQAATTIRGRHKKQSGGHGQFGDVVVTIEPLARGEGFQFHDKIVGGVVPKHFISAVEIGVRDYLQTGPLGCHVVDVAVTLIDGSTHSVDSSDMAFRQAGRIAMAEGMPKCQPVLLEPIMAIEISVPNDATPRVNSMISQRRGQIVGFDARPGWPGWDVVEARIPASEMGDLIVELRSATSGVGTFVSRLNHYAELTGRLADKALAVREGAGGG
ncbi:MAG: elongation factor G [Hyphomicrobiaceae bacterium]